MDGSGESSKAADIEKRQSKPHVMGGSGALREPGLTSACYFIRDAPSFYPGRLSSMSTLEL
jgi:hypothetical protein